MCGMRPADRTGVRPVRSGTLRCPLNCALRSWRVSQKLLNHCCEQRSAVLQAGLIGGDDGILQADSSTGVRFNAGGRIVREHRTADADVVAPWRSEIKPTPAQLLHPAHGLPTDQQSCYDCAKGQEAACRTRL